MCTRLPFDSGAHCVDGGDHLSYVVHNDIRLQLRLEPTRLKSNDRVGVRKLGGGERLGGWKRRQDRKQ